MPFYFCPSSTTLLHAGWAAADLTQASLLCLLIALASFKSCCYSEGPAAQAPTACAARKDCAAAAAAAGLGHRGSCGATYTAAISAAACICWKVLAISWSNVSIRPALVRCSTFSSGTELPASLPVFTASICMVRETYLSHQKMLHAWCSTIFQD